MAVFKDLRQTNVGRAGLAKSIATGKDFVINRVGLGDGYMAEGSTRQTMTDLSNWVIDAEIISKTFEDDGSVLVKARVPKDMPFELKLREVGVFARLDGGEFLFTYDNAGEGADTVPAGGGFVDSILNLKNTIGDAENVSVLISPPAIDDHLLQYVIQESAQRVIDNVTAQVLEPVMGSIVNNLNVIHEADVIVAMEGQDEFTLYKTDPKGALDVFINGLAIHPIGWTVVGGAVKLAIPVPEGHTVWIQETRFKRSQ